MATETQSVKLLNDSGDIIIRFQKFPTHQFYSWPKGAK